MKQKVIRTKQIVKFSGLKSFEIMSDPQLNNVKNCIASIKICCADKTYQIPYVYFDNNISGGIFEKLNQQGKYTDRTRYIKLIVEGMLLASDNIDEFCEI